MKHITFVRPALGLGRSRDAMEPLVFAILKARTPAHIETLLIDERIATFRPVKTDLVAITVETFTARRAYEIAGYYRAKGIPVILGGHHPSMLPDEAALHADSVAVGDAEGMWERILGDAERNQLKPVYRNQPQDVDASDIRFDRSLYDATEYGPVRLVQAGRGCRFACDFCSIHAFYGKHREQRPVAHIAAEIAALPKSPLIFFVDDNLLWRRDRFVALMKALVPLKRRWSCQITIDVAKDNELLDLMRDAGCRLALIGFESLTTKSLKQMHKNWNGVAGSYEQVIAKFHARGIMIYGTFVFGYDADVPEAFDVAAAFARNQNLAIANFNPLTPMPGTGLYARLKQQGELLRPNWWIDPGYRYGDAIFTPKSMSPEELQTGPMRARRSFYSVSSIVQRTMRGLVMWRDPYSAGLALVGNVVSRQEIFRKQARSLSNAAPTELMVRQA
jgi:radical SAM superfamily enzyme YgiQ (UPF0313 family)